ncbi:hypothetical protein, partial [Methylophaga nitratireducenticrescens]|uniref:Uncharacterized protein n=1 Tax=Methylophaga nitratireducenticrescens TaxID=754476 RepID=I1XKG4_METNJ
MHIQHLGWVEAADHVVSGASGVISNARVTGNLAQAIGVDALSCSDYAAAVIQNM